MSLQRSVRVGVAVALGLTAVVAPAGAGAAVRPNVVVIVADDLGWNDVGYHNPVMRTPNLDRLAAGGVRLEHHYVFPTCSPTRCALLTGRNPARFDILGPIGGRSEQALPPGTKTLADVLKTVGYATAIAGKWHMGLTPGVGPRKYGFDQTYGYLHGQIDPDTHLYKNGDRTWHRDDAFLDETGHATDLLAEAAVKWVGARRDVPYFLYLCFSVPHHPLREDDRWVTSYGATIADPSRRLFAAAVTHMDDAIGRVVAAIARAGQTETTLIVFTSDNGGQKDYAPGGEYGGKAAASPTLGDNRPLRGWKGELYEGGVRVPAFASWPGTLAPRVVDAPVSALDWLPTLAALTGAAVDPAWGWEGVDAWPVLNGRPAAGPRLLFWKTGKDAAVRDGDWKLIVARKGSPAPQLFNLAADPLETTDLAATQPGRVAALKKRLDEGLR